MLIGLTHIYNHSNYDIIHSPAIYLHMLGYRITTIKLFKIIIFFSTVFAFMYEIIFCGIFLYNLKIIIVTYLFYYLYVHLCTEELVTKEK